MQNKAAPCLPSRPADRAAMPANAWKDKETYLQALLQDPWYACSARLLSALYVATHRFFEAQGIDPYVFPITTGSVSSPMGLGSDSEPVQIALRNNQVYLADSMQFSLEVGARLSGKGAYYVMPTFRGEPVDGRHLNEFVHAEVEIHGTLSDIQHVAEAYIRAMAAHLLDTCASEIEQTAGSTAHLVDLLSRQDSFKKISYSDAVTELSGTQGTLEDLPTGCPAITSLGEKLLMQRHGDFIWLCHMPWANVPFYQARMEGTPYSLTGDLLAGIGEILGCGQRVHTSDDLHVSLAAHDVSLSGYEWYGQMRALRPLQTSGFGLGIERFLLWVTQTNDIRNCSLLYRDHDTVFYP